MKWTSGGFPAIFKEIKEIVALKDNNDIKIFLKTIFSSERKGFLFAKGVNKTTKKTEDLLKSIMITIITSTQDHTKSFRRS